MKKLYFFGALLLVVAVSGIGFLHFSRIAAAEQERSERQQILDAGPRVRVAKAELSKGERKIELQGEARPFASVTLYAKLSGYLKDIRVDKGDRVKKDQILAVIESPETDRQYEAAVADAAYKKTDAKRLSELAQPGVVPIRDAQLQESQAKVAAAQVSALDTQRSYETLRAPFSGTVTARFADPGALVQNATNAQTSALPVIALSQVDRLRVYLYVDQRDAAFVKVGNVASVSVPNRGIVIPATVTRLASELDAATRTMLVEIDLDNRDGKIVPGSFVSVSITIPAPPAMELPVEALLVRDKQTEVAIIDADARIHFRPVTVMEDDGARLRLKSGVEAGDRVALNLGDRAVEGARVQPIDLQPAEAHAPAK